MMISQTETSYPVVTLIHVLVDSYNVLLNQKSVQLKITAYDKEWQEKEINTI